jgi:hypothetical protein
MKKNYNIKEFSDKQQTHPLIREDAHINKTVIVELNLISGHEPQMGFDTKMD